MNEENKDKAYMEEALGLAKEAYSDGEVPVGAVVVWEDGRIVGKGRNRREKGKCALCHAEMEAIKQACKTLGGWRLHKATLYVTTVPKPYLNTAMVLQNLGATASNPECFIQCIMMNAQCIIICLIT